MNIIISRTPGKVGNAGHGPEYHKPPPVDVPHKYRARQAASLWERESTRRQGRGNEVGPGEGAPARMAVCDTAGRKAAGGGDESAARVDASCEQPVKPRRFLTSHRPRVTGDGNGTGNPQVVLQEKDIAMSLTPRNLGNGQEQYETFTSRMFRKPFTYVHYDYRHTNGKLFSCVAKTLDEARARRDQWLSENDV